MKTRVRVTLMAEEQVEIGVEHAEDEDPTDLAKEDRERAMREASVFANWDVDDVEEA